MPKTILAAIMSLFLLTSFLAGCQGAVKKPATPQQNTPPKTSNMDVSASERRVMASRLSKIAQDVQGVNKASVAVTDGTTTTGAGASQGALVVLVGLTLNPTISSDANQMNAVKKSVADRIKANDNRISQVLITSDPTMIKRINDVAAGIIEGKPIQSYENDVNKLARDLKQPNQTY
ncbi:MAG TPA: YhcN/YlaJ family sporulation lipoprotein [Syntrophomonadaceae bacterium]|nr:YhcN/YlaJ family sporulation lipoprotein [Syntrophomonadaceae bacterium]